jgi:hypothetical protein
MAGAASVLVGALTAAPQTTQSSIKQLAENASNQSIGSDRGRLGAFGKQCSIWLIASEP